MKTTSISQTQRLLLALTFPVTIVFLYFLFRKNEDEEEDELQLIRKNPCITVKVPREAVSAVIGTQGSQIKKIEESTNTKIHFSDESSTNIRDGSDRILVIRGNKDSCKRAEEMVRCVISDQLPIETDVIFVPKIAIDRILGPKGATIRSLGTLSKAKIIINRHELKSPSKKFVEIQIKGSAVAIVVAKRLIMEKVDNEISSQEGTSDKEIFSLIKNRTGDLEKNLTAHEDNTNLLNNLQLKNLRQLNKQLPIDEKLDVNVISQLNEAVINAPINSKETYTSELNSSSIINNPSLLPIIPLSLKNATDYMAVYISAVEHPDHFWIQVLDSNALQLEQLVTQMNDCYAKLNDKEAVQNVFSVGDMVAAPFYHDNCWYRAKVMEIMDSDVDLYYVDFGDSEILSKNSVKQLRNDFLILPFQAIECCLANVKPLDKITWSESATTAFEDLVHVAKWEPLMCKITGYKKLMDTSSVPALILIDTNNQIDINIADELVKKGLAIPKLIDDEQTLSSEMSTIDVAENVNE